MMQHLQTVLNYFGYFSYAPSFDEIYTFFPRKISKKNLKTLLAEESKRNNRHGLSLRAKHTVAKQSLPIEMQVKMGLPRRYAPRNDITPTFTTPQHTLPQYSIPRTIQRYIYLLNLCPLVRFVGVTGRSAMQGLKKHDDLDLCIVTKHNLLWTTRFCVITLAKILGIYGFTGVCLNLFFDEGDLMISKQKQNSYIAHELLQMKPIIDKKQIYQQFFTKNRWVYRYFPNATSLVGNNDRCSLQKLPVTCYRLQKTIDNFFKSLQLPLIIRNRTGFYITPTQLWLFKSDFEKKLKRAGLVI